MRAGIALGSNLGDRPLHLQRAVNALRHLAKPDEPFLVSRVYETTPVDCPPDSPTFLNAAVEFSFDGPPTKLLAALQAIEAAHGRPDERALNSPRPIDLDILYFGDLLIEQPDLVVPHPRLVTRQFVLAPLADIRPDLVLPTQKATIAELLADRIFQEPLAVDVSAAPLS